MTKRNFLKLNKMKKITKYNSRDINNSDFFRNLGSTISVSIFISSEYKIFLLKLIFENYDYWSNPKIFLKKLKMQQNKILKNKELILISNYNNQKILSIFSFIRDIIELNLFKNSSFFENLESVISNSILINSGYKPFILKLISENKKYWSNNQIFLEELEKSYKKIIRNEERILASDYNKDEILNMYIFIKTLVEFNLFEIY
ncbi:hypothetical protein SSYRP_v1c04450 [Spiroplasma syrphidicola EA-1]|uniref:Uncharacterized protein n=1 Tax=Spiroplasma syrphidicola EA-1 TaxID=1276229 RepID=R4U3P4_9MOLU|nr:hypothetical protein [Spiroplasma syrphidicola]AGM26037.1 hypothetical protein SSYRP_v1c04450 [Spiroplasma syrphidicola EA-1]